MADITFVACGLDEVFWEQIVLNAVRLGNSASDAMRKADIIVAGIRERRIKND